MTYGLRELRGDVVEVCDECGFSSQRVPDVAASFERAFAEMESLQQRPDAAKRPSKDVWSAAEYAHHVIDGSNTVASLVTAALRRPAPVAATDLSSARRACVELAMSVSDTDRVVPCPFEGAPTDVGQLVLHLLHDVEHHVLDVRRGYATIDLGVSAAVYPVETDA